MSHPIVTTVTLTAAVANGIALSQSLGGAGPLTLNGSKVTAGVAILDAPRRVIITSAGNDSGITWTITGTRGSWWAQQSLIETIAGGNVAAAQSTQDFLTVTSIVGSGASASTVTAGTNGAAAGPWVVWSKFAKDFQVSVVGMVLTGAPTWSLEYTYDDVFGIWLPAGVLFPRALQYGPLTGITGTADGALTNAGVMASRLALTVVGSAQLTQQQQGT